MKSARAWYCREQSPGEKAFIQKYLELYRASGLKMAEATAEQRYEWEIAAKNYAVQFEPLITAVKYKKDYQLVVYQDQEIVRTINLKPFLNLNTSPLADQNYFRKVQILADRTGIYWPDGYTIYTFSLGAYDATVVGEDNDSHADTDTQQR